MGASALKTSNRFKALGSVLVGMKLNRTILDNSPHNFSVSHFSVSPSGRCGGVHFDFFKSI